MEPRRPDLASSALRFGRGLAAGALGLVVKAARGEPGRVARRVLAPSTRRQIRQVLAPDRLAELAGTFGAEATELAEGAVARASQVPGLGAALDPETRRLAAELADRLQRAARRPVRPEEVEALDPELIRRLAPPLDAFMRAYFRFEVEGMDRVPAGPALLVGNHEAGTSFVQVLGMGARWYLERGLDDRISGLMHDGLFEVPLLASLLGQLGAVRASHASAEAAFDRGFKVFVFPGGNLEAFRPFSERHRVKLGGRRGWIRLARRAGVPVVPVVFIGGHETFFVLTDGQRLARGLGLHEHLRLDTLPVWLGLPFGLGVGPMFHLPLPSKCKVRFLEPIELAAAPGETEEQTESRIYSEVTGAMQAALTEMAAERVLPVLG